MFCVPCDDSKEESNDQSNLQSTKGGGSFLKAKTSPADILKMLEIIQDEILPKTKEGVQKGNKVFGAAILDANFAVVHANTNNELKCPLLHGEVNAIMEWSKIVPPSERGAAAQSSVFLSTHEPCCMCISSIVWAGFQTVYYFFPYAATTDQGIPWDVETMHELWGVESYRRENKFCKTACLIDLIDGLDDLDDSHDHGLRAIKNELKMKRLALNKSYDELSKRYHDEKVNNVDNSLVLG